jgi:hypothetical protein
MGVWSAVTLWAALVSWMPAVMPGPPGKDIGLHWAALINLVPAALAGVGFLLGLGLARGRSRGGGAGRWFAFALGLVFPLTAWLLRPLFGYLSPGLWPGLAWFFVGSVLVAWVFRRVGRG